MKTSIIIPCYNEVKTIDSVVNNIINNCDFDKEIIIVDDCSNDGTIDLLKENIVHKVDKIIYNKKNYGKGYSVKMGIPECEGEIIVIQDADLEYDPKEIKHLLEPIKLGFADVVFGSRFVSSRSRRVNLYWHSLANYYLTLFSNMLTNLNLSDMEVGFKVFKTEHIKSIKLYENRFGFEPEITAKIAKKKLRVYEIGVSYNGRGYDEGKKITWKDGISAIYCIIKYNIFK
tara:strand:- start:1782 stop:2471 length:690 start_codon:yes stop_codon:yes gene_type:complete